MSKNNILRFEVVRHPVGTLQVDGEIKDTYSLSYLISKDNAMIHLTQHEFDTLLKEGNKYIGKVIVTE